MQKITIQSNVALPFPPYHRGFVEMEIDLIQNLPNEDRYELRIIDRCFELENIPKPNNSNVATIKKYIGLPQTRYTSFSYTEMKQLVQALSNAQAIPNEPLSPEFINKIFQKGLLFITKKECKEGKGMYHSEESQWIITQ